MIHQKVRFHAFKGIKEKRQSRHSSVLTGVSSGIFVVLVLGPTHDKNALMTILDECTKNSAPYSSASCQLPEGLPWANMNVVSYHILYGIWYAWVNEKTDNKIQTTLIHRPSRNEDPSFQK